MTSPLFQDLSNDQRKEKVSQWIESALNTSAATHSLQAKMILDTEISTAEMQQFFEEQGYGEDSQKQFLSHPERKQFRQELMADRKSYNKLLTAFMQDSKKDKKKKSRNKIKL